MVTVTIKARVNEDVNAVGLISSILNGERFVVQLNVRRCRIQSQQESERSVDRLRQSLEAAASERQQLDQLHQNLGHQLDELACENKHLQAAHSDLERQRCRLQDDRDDLAKELERLNRERERWSVLLCIGLLLISPPALREARARRAYVLMLFFLIKILLVISVSQTNYLNI